MKKRGGGSVVFIGSQSSFIPLVPQIAYASAKAALSTAMYFMAKELGPDNIRGNTCSWTRDCRYCRCGDQARTHRADPPSMRDARVTDRRSFLFLEWRKT